MCEPGANASFDDVLAAAEASLSLVAAAQPGLLADVQLADGLKALERAESALTAGRARLLSAFAARAGFEADGHGAPGSWLSWQTRITRGAAAGAMGWMRRLAAHALVADALAARQISTSWARHICDWSARLPPDRQDEADQILLAAATGGAGLADLSGLAEEMFRRCAPPDRDDGDGGFSDRSVRLDLHYRGAGKIAGDLTPECASAVAAMLEALGKKAGPEDDRTQLQRDHDALEEACRRLAAAGGLPDRAGQPTQVQLRMTLDQLRSLPGAADAEQAWAAGRAAGDGEPGWFSSRAAAEAYACDARIVPIVTGHVDPAALARMTACFLAGADSGADPGAGPGARPLPPETVRRLQDVLLRAAADVLSGPAGMAAFLRTGLLADEFPAAVSLPLETGAATDTVPPHLRRMVITRDRHCAHPGCRQRPAACHVHHLKPRSQGGKTVLGNLILLCAFHHLIAIHRWGWSIQLNADGTTTATSPDGRRTLHGHGPPEATAA